MSTRERMVALLLNVSGGVMILALFAIVLPTDWMAATHRWLGLGEFPASPLVDYLTRSASALYAVYGGLLVLLARDVRRFAPVIVYLAVTGLVFGVVMIGVDVTAGMPRYWRLGEGPMVLVLSAVMLWLARGIQPLRGSSA